MERVDDIVVVEVGGGCLVGHVHRMGKRQVPNRERLILRIAGFDTALVFVVQLRKAGCHLAGARARSGDNYQGAAGFQILVLTVSLVAHDMVDVIAGSRQWGSAGSWLRPASPDGSGTLLPWAALHSG